MDFHQALEAAREARYEGPRSVHGRRYAVNDFLMDSGVEFGGATSPVASFMGIDVHYDETMPANTVEFRGADSEVQLRLLQDAGRWFRVAVDPSQGVR